MDRVCRAYILPRLSEGTDEPVYVEVINAQQGRGLLSKLKKVINYAIKDYLDSSGKSKIETVEDLYNLLNEIVATLKWSLFLDPLPGVVPSPTILIKLFLRRPRYLDEDLGKLLTDEAEVYEAIIVKYDHEKIKELQEDLRDILRYPADTRPAANSSSLLIHMIVTSAIATCIFASQHAYLGAEWLKRVTMLRLLSLFHDIGKFDVTKWHEHEKLSSSIVEELFSEYVEGEAKDLVMKVVDVLASRQEDYLTKIFRQADEIASNIDRLPKYFFKALSAEEERELKEVSHSISISLEEAYKTWAFWERIGFEGIRALSEKFAKRASRVTKDNPLLCGEDIKIVTKDVFLARLDIRNIQKYIAVEDLRSLCGASRIVDIVTMVIIPAYLVTKVGLPPENVLYFGGGNITIIIPRTIGGEEVIEKVKLMLNKKLSRELGISLTLGVSPVYDSFAYTNRCIDSEIAKQKLLEVPSREVSPNIMYVCDLCGEGYAEERIDGDRLVCRPCYVKHFFGDTVHFRWKLARLKEVFKVNVPTEDIKDIVMHVMEYIAGISWDALRRRSYKEYPYVALMRFDGNLISQIMATAVSITDAVERSVRIDYALKSALHKFLEVLKGISDEDFVRLVLGVMYVGGDDGFLLSPSYLALPLAIHLAREYYRNMGFKSTISVGIAVAKPKHPIWELYRAAGYMLNELSKEFVRELAVELHSDEARASYDFCGGIAFYVAESGTMTDESLDAVIRSLSERRLTLMGKRGQGYRVSPASDMRSLLRPLSIIFNDISLENFNVASLLFTIVYSANKAREGSSSSLSDLLRDLRNDALDIMYKSFFDDDSLKVKVVHAIRQSHRLETLIQKHYYKEILLKLLDVEKGLFPLHDFIQIIKIIDGDVKREGG